MTFSTSSPYSRGLALLLASGGTTLLPLLGPSSRSSIFVSGHGHLPTPRSRNFFAYEAGRDDTTNSPPGLPPREYCSHCLNAKLATDTCGRGSAQSYDPNPAGDGPVNGWLDTYGNPMPWISQATYVEGQEILVSIELTTNHAGHAEVRACPMPDNGSDVASQACFDAHPLTFTRDVCHGGPVDDVYPVRGYFSNQVMHHFIYKLPTGLTSDKLLLQWRYIAANSCIPPGYKDEARLGLDARGWLRGFSMEDCTVEDDAGGTPQLVLDPTGARGPGDPEQFWNCAEVTVVAREVDGSNDPGPHLAGMEICGDVNPSPPTPPTTVTPPMTPTTSNPVPSPGPVDPNTEGYCNWGPLGTAMSSTCDGCVQGGSDCNGGAHQCESDCGGRWCTNVEAINPTCSDVLSPNPPSPSPPPPTPSNTNYCGTSWMNAKESSCKPLSDGGGLMETSQPCSNGNSTVCNSGAYCYADIICSTVPAPTPDPTSPTGPSPPTPIAPTPPVTPPPPGTLTASTTRYWDCSGGACGCAYLPNGAGTDDSPAHCHSNAMFAAPPNNEYGATFYGAAAISRFLWDGNTNMGDWMGEGCGKCWKVTGSSNTGPNQGVSTTIVLKGTNICPTGICNENGKAHFDIAAPGFDVDEFSWSNTCATLEAGEIEGFKSCGRWMIDTQVWSENCDCSKFISPVLKAGCENFYSMKWDNPSVVYEEVSCPQEIATLPCWEENGNGYPQDGIPETCMDPNGDPNVILPFPGGNPPSPPSPPSPTVPSPPTPNTPPPAPSPFGPIQCPDGYETARWTWYISYPKCCPDQAHYDPLAPTDECDIYNGCAWDGDFAYVGNRPFSYVQNTDIVAFFASSGETFSKKIIRVYSPGHDKTVDAIVLDTCGDADCNGCCTENANTGGGYLVDMEENTVVRHFGALNEASGLVCWKILPDEEYNAGGYCNYSGCNGEAQGGWDCNLNEFECETTCGGSWCPTTATPPPVEPPTPPPVNPVTPPPVEPPTQPPIEPVTPPPVEPPTLPPVQPPTQPPIEPVTPPPVEPPTLPPVQPPTQPPIEPVTPPPVNPPTTPPVQPPTLPPVEPPTQPPVNPPTVPPVEPPTPPPASGGDPCCTWDMKTCSLDDWCNASESNCKNSCSGPYWMDASAMEHMHFLPLPCNSDFSMPCQPLDISHVIGTSNSSVYVVPCGTCQVLDGNDFVNGDNDGAIANFAGGLNVEGHLQILPPTNAASTLWIKSPFVFVQGKLTVDTEPVDRLGAIHIELLDDDDADIMMLPHASNSMACASHENGACPVGKRPFVVAGGQVDIRGYKQSCPSWTNLVNVVIGGMAQVDPSQYDQAPATPSAACSSIVVSQSFDSSSSLSSDLNSWDGNGAAEYGIISEGEESYYKVSTRGPRVMLANPQCLTPGVPYLFSVKIKLSTSSTGTPSACSVSGGWSCPRLMLYRKLATGSQKWRRLGRMYTLQDDTWETFQLQATFTADEVGPSSDNQMVSLFLEGPEAAVDMSVDDFILELAPPGTYPDPNQVCAELLPNGDAEHGSGANIFPFTFAGGDASVVTDEDNGNSFFRQSKRTSWYMRLNTKLVTGCVVEDVVYRMSAKVWVHSSVPKQAEIVAGSTQPDGSTDWSTMLLCPYSDETSGFVVCEAMLSFSPKQIAATDITLFIRPRGDATSTVDWDDMSLQFVSGPAEELLVDPSLYDCWADQISQGAEVLLTSHTLDSADSQVVSASGMTSEGKISLASSFTNPMSGPNDFTVEVALLSRRIVLEASSDGSIGGHFIVLHTPDVKQTIRGVQIKGFGQQGILGRYPIHFHMCGNVDGSVVSHNVILNSNQRCLVAHGTNALLIEDNVAYNTAGHCYMLEDGGEVNNVFQNNLGALTKKVSTLISNDETDDEPSTYWITNPQNTFENNVAAGSESSGFWFELRTRVRGPSASLHPGVNPSKLPLKSFVGNVAHSNRGSGLATYPGAGYNPDEEAEFIDNDFYRNRGSGIFFHNSGLLSIQGGTFADNRIGVDVDRAHSLRIIGSHIVGVTPSFAESVSSSGKTGHCPSMNPVIGVQLHSSKVGGTTASGVILQDLSFDHLGEDTQCPGSSALGVDPNENFAFFDPRTSMEGLVFSDDTTKLNLCPAVDSGINVAIEDMDGSLDSSTGFIVSNNAEMTTFASCTAVSDASCVSICGNTCLRTLSLSVSSLTPENLQLVVKEGTDDAPSISLSGYFDYRDWDPYWNTRSHFTRRFFVTLPASGSYQAQFISDNTLTWPVFVESSWEDVDGCGPAFSLDIDENGSRNCDQLIVNGDAEGGSTEGWWHTAGGIEISATEGGANGSFYSFSSQFRHYSSFGIAQFLDTRCMVEGRKYMLQASVKLVDQDGSAYTCIPPGVAYNLSPCPEAHLKSRVGTTNSVDSYHTIATMDSWTTGDWNTMTGTFTVTGEQASAGSVLLAWHRAPPGVQVILDEITLSCVSGCE